MLRCRSIDCAHVASRQPLVGQWKPSRTINSCTLLVSIFTITVSHPVGSLWSCRLRRLLQEGTVFQLRVLPYSISCLRAHQPRHTSRLGSSQHRLHRHQSSFACLKPQQAVHYCVQPLFRASPKSLRLQTCLLSTACSNIRSATLQYLKLDTQGVSSAASIGCTIISGHTYVRNIQSEPTG